MASEIELIKSTRGAQLLVYNDYVYRKRNNYGGTTYWTCVDKNCKGKVNIDLNNLITGKTDHCHEPDISAIVAYKQRYSVKDEARKSNFRSCQQVYSEVTNKMLVENEYGRDEVAASLKTFNQLKNSIAKARSDRFPTQPRTRLEINVPDDLGITNTGERFFRISDGHENKIMLFFTSQFLKFLCDAEHVYSDGTFKSVPGLFHSLYSFHVMKSGIMIPTVYALIPDATVATYLRVLRLIQDSCYAERLFWNPKKFTTDFEMAFHRAVLTVFPSCALKSCLFHFSQAIWRNIGKHNLVTRYRADHGANEVRLATKRISALPFLKESDISPTYELIKQLAPQDEDMGHFFEYFESTYLNANARFPIWTWNHFDDNDPRTNNHLEGWHAALNRSVGHSHANIWLYIEKLTQQQNNFDSKVLMAAHGALVINKPTKYAQIDQKIKTLTVEYKNDGLTAFDFLDKVKFYTRLESN